MNRVERSFLTCRTVESLAVRTVATSLDPHVQMGTSMDVSASFLRAAGIFVGEEFPPASLSQRLVCPDAAGEVLSSAMLGEGTGENEGSSSASIRDSDSDSLSSARVILGLGRTTRPGPPSG